MQGLLTITATLLLIFLTPAQINGQVTVRFVDTQKTVSEGNQFTLRVQRVGSSLATINVVVSVNDPNQDFIGNSQVATFVPGRADTTFVTFTVSDDSIPEIETTHNFQLAVIGNTATAEAPNVATVTITANDDAYGVFTFLEQGGNVIVGTDGQKSLTEIEGTTTVVVNILIGRQQGRFGQVTVSYTIEGTDVTAEPGVDITPATGSVSFQDGEDTNILQLQIRADNVPENDEEFHVILTSATQGARVLDNFFILNIKANDAPVRFNQSEFRFDEGPYTRTVSLTLHRGLQSDGVTRIGAVDNSALVNYVLTSGSAYIGQDFQGLVQLATGSVAFAPGQTVASINVEITDDSDPEMEESFQAILSSTGDSTVLADPSSTVVIINANDNHAGILSFRSPNMISPPTQLVDEDSTSSLTFVVIRTVPSYGEVSVDWQVFRNDSSIDQVTFDLSPASGTVTFAEGEPEKSITLSVIEDSVPEPAERFVIRLLPNTVTGQAKVEGIIYGIIIIEDSDDLYGTVQFSPDTSRHSIVVDADPRMLQLTLERSTPNIGDVLINMTITYTQSVGIQDVLEDTEVAVVMFSGVMEKVEHIHLLSSASLQVGGLFSATLKGVTLVTKPAIGAFNTPKLGSQNQVNVFVKATEANGEIGFDTSKVMVVNEPTGSPSTVNIKLTREGTSGQATISWSMQGTSTSAIYVTVDDAGPQSGQVVMASGSMETIISITIMPDDIPELDEELTITLTKVEPTSSQRLKVDARSQRVIISENDNPGGVFEFADSVRTSYVMAEGGSQVDFIVERTGGTLVEKFVQYEITPNGNEEFFGATNVLVFSEAMTRLSFSVLAKADGVPEMNETFALTIRGYKNSSVTLGTRSSVDLLVPQNNEPYGQIQFKDIAITYLDEGTTQQPVHTPVAVERQQGLFGTVQVMWSVEPNTGVDIRPVSGFITFVPLQEVAFISLESVPDDIPEQSETFIITLSDPQGGAVLGVVNTKTLIMKENDYPLYFTSLIVETEEPSEVSLILRRDGGLDNPLTVKYRTVDDMASSDSADYLPIDTRILTFAIGEDQKMISVRILDDGLAEGNETFFVRVYEIEGNAVMVNSTDAMVSILANDQAYGIFQFAAPYQLSVEEGIAAKFFVSRDESGLFGGIRVFYEIYKDDQKMRDGDEFNQAENLFVDFGVGESTKAIYITPRMDLQPENEITYTVVLSEIQVIEGRRDVTLALIGDQDNRVFLTILASDDPNGRFGFSLDSKEVTIAEDFSLESESSSKVALPVERRMGAFGTVQVLWEVYTYLVGGDLPDMVDLIFIGNMVGPLILVPSIRRPNTGTDVILLPGDTAGYVSVPSRYHPTQANIVDGFSITAWVQPYASTNGYVITKTNSGGSRHFYAVKLNVSQLVFSYSVTGSNENEFATIPLLKNIADASWHHLVVTLEGSLVSVYLDSAIQGSRSLPSGQVILDSAGRLTVGAVYPGKEQFAGFLQDVRIYSRSLKETERMELFMGAAGNDIVPTSGYLTYIDEIREGQIEVRSKQDLEEETNEVFIVKLVNTRGGANISQPDSVAIVTVLKSDNANGLFSFAQPCQPSSAMENMTLVCELTRNRGDAGSVMVTWVAYQIIDDQSYIATEDFLDFTGSALFIAGQRSQTFRVTVKADGIPEDVEIFEIRLVNATSDDNVAGSTDSSGASIDTANSGSSLTVGKNDFYHGLLQFTTNNMPPTSSNPVITPLTQRPMIRVSEESGLVRLLVARAQGSQGEVVVEWRTTDGTAKSSGTTTPDYSAGVGRLTFTNGQRYTYIDINIIDNNIPEDEKSFLVTLLNPSGGANIGMGSSIQVVIDHSDGAFGVFQFADTSLGVQGEETGDSDFNTLALQVARTDGSIGQVDVTWQLLSDLNNDFVESQGNMTFGNGQLSAPFELKVRGDTAPELDELFFVELIAVSRGSLGERSKLRSEVTILANDDPYGLFVIPESQRPVSVDEGNTVVTMTIERLFGLNGQVEVNYTTVHSNQSFPFMPNTVPRADQQDFIMTTGSVLFNVGDMTNTFDVTILDDTEPEESEAVFVQLTGVTLVEGSQIRSVDNSPRLGSDSKTYGQIIINSNDNANGEIQLSSLFATVYENRTEPVLSVVRYGGAFGEVSVSFIVTTGTALQDLDYLVLATQVTLYRGDKQVRLPIQIIDDNIPEVAEMFSVQLDQVSGGGVLGTVTSATVTIAASDDPYGAFGFSVSSQSIEEPSSPQGLQVDIIVFRSGGTLGVVTVNWVATLNGVPALSDITQTTGSVYFLSNEARRQISLTVLADDIPEGQEDIKITLITASNGGRIGSNNVFTLSILANDNPHGVVQFTSSSYTVTEELSTSVQTLDITRTGGNFGQLRVFYSTEALLGVSTTPETSNSTLDYFSNPQIGSRGVQGQGVLVPAGQDPTQICARACLARISCQSFEVYLLSGSGKCTLYQIVIKDPSILDSTIFYYIKDVTKAGEITGVPATPGEDYSVVTNGYIILEAGVTTGGIPVSIQADSIPELDEKFQVRLVSVEVIGAPPAQENSPYLGEVRNATVTIKSNDDTFGAFRLYSTSPAATNDGHVIPVEEKSQLAVDLIVERKGGSIGEVSVQWTIDGNRSTAVNGVDYLADGATLTFIPGETRKSITITILDDVLPEDRKFIVVRLTNNTGGTEIRNGTATIVILENDYVAGILALSSTSILAREGDTVSVNVTRTIPALGTVTVDWYIQGIGNFDPATGFQTYRGHLEFIHEEMVKTLILTVLSDNQPEAMEEYQLNLANIQTMGIGSTGAAIVSQMSGTASITIEGSNDPHGVFQFADTSQNVRMFESDGILNVSVIRKFGAIGGVRVQYEITAGSVSVPSADLVPATANGDFIALQSYVEMADGASSTPIRVQIIEDNDPEVDEVFVVRLLSVTLVNPGTSTLLPKLASSGIVSQVIINANDGTKGVAIFNPDYAVVAVDEISKNISLTVKRDRGTFGEVSVFYYAQSITESTNMGLDFQIEPKEIHFLSGETQKQIVIEIINDELPEPDETFQVILSNPKNGLVLGTPSRVNVTILANDDASGFVYFETEEIITLEEPGGDNLVPNKVEITVVRGPGMYGIVNVPFEVIPELSTNRDDLSPMQGSVTFQDKQTTAKLSISVLDDELPEETERFTVQLREPDNTAQLGTRTEVTLVISPNDSPNGLFSLYSADTRQREISVEEGTETIYFDIVRSQGLEGQVMVDIATEPGTAMSTADVTNVQLVPVQTLSTSNVGGWFSYNFNDSLYLLMMKSDIVGELTSRIGTDGSDGPVAPSNMIKTALFRWQGELLPLQTVQTDGISGATMFTIDTVGYLFITNKGNYKRYEVMSRLYEIKENGTLLLIQDIGTKGAKDAVSFTRNGNTFLVIVNSVDNGGNTKLASDIYRWDSGTQKFTKMADLTTLGASSLAVFELDTVLYLAVANNYDSEQQTYEVGSKIYKFSENSQFSQHQSITTRGAIDVKYSRIRDLHLLVFANNRDNTVSSPQMSDVYRWEQTTQMFVRHERLETNRVESLQIFTAYDDTVYVAFANSIGESTLYAWDVQANHFKLAWTGSPAISLYPIRVTQRSGQLDLIAMANKNSTRQPVVYQLIKVKNSDFAPRTMTMTFDPGQTLLHATMVVLQDTMPEDTETFYVTIKSPQGGAEVGPNNRIAVNILSNDNAHGILEFAQDSIEVSKQELAGRENTFQLNVIRHQGFFGLVAVRWVATGDQDGTNDITPLEGMVEFGTGQSVATISLTIKDDDVAELAEVTYVQLIEIVEAGTSLTGRGALIGMNKTARVTVQANDSPYGVVRWEQTSISTLEPDGTDFTIVFYILRQQGMMGSLQVTYMTSVNMNSPRDRQAISGVDYIARQGMVIIQENVGRAPVEVVIKQDSVPEAAETFLVNITKVVLIGSSPVPGAEPSILIPGNVVTVTISENDNARGIVQFNVTRNIEGRIDIYEEYGLNTTVLLKVSRTIGFFGSVTVTWQADRREATVLDFYPSSGTISLADTQETASLYITIVDDDIAEDMESFDVELISVTGGALLGPDSAVRIAILKNDSPNGLFRFVTLEAVVRESLTSTDPDGEVRLIVERIQGAEGVVNVGWRLNAEAVYDFYEPHSGTLLFSQGEKTKTLLLRTKPDQILEGQEKFQVSLISTDNNADISHTEGDTSITVLPDPGASGTISVVPEYRTVYIGEPGESDPSYNGKTQVVLTRGDGIYGDIAVTWSITPRDNSAFIQIDGTISFVDLQQKATIIIQALDDVQAELRSVYTLQLNSATGGAKLSQISRAITADIVFVASDYPHGVFVFDLPPFVITTEDQYSVTVPVTRTAGLNRQVLVSYITMQGTATSYDDFFPVEGTLTFQHGENRQIIEVKLNKDDIPEGLESFYLNLTSARLQVPNNNNYSEVNGLQLDMAPVIGSLSTKEIRIEKNDNAEGTIQFDVSASQFGVTEESRQARIPLERLGGNFGRVSVRYTTSNISALETLDYVVPNGEAIFSDGARSVTINITILDDSIMEPAEQFQVRLTGTTGGAVLGDRLLSTVIISKSDYPNGQFGFRGPLKIKLDNPANLMQQMFSVERTGGLTGQQTVYWRILGPNNPGAVLLSTNDIAFTSNRKEVTQGSLLWEDGQAGERTVTLDIKPFSSWEIEKVFIIHIYQIQSFPLNVGNGEISPTSGNVTLTISKFGDPNGIIQFHGAAQGIREVEEPDGISTLTLRFPIIRRQDTGTVGNIQIFWTIRGPQDEVADFEPINGSVLVGDEERSGEIVIQILPDNTPELTEEFTLVLSRIDGGAEIDTQFNTSRFRIRYNDQPHGLFGLIPEYQSVVVDPVELTRSVRLNFTRYSGNFGSTVLTFTIKYNLPQSGIVLSVSDGTVQFNNGDTEKIADITIQGTGFLEIGTTFSVSLLQVQYLGAGVTDPPKFKAGQTEVKVAVPAIAANSKVGFESQLSSVNEERGTASVTLVRDGTYGTLEVAWQGGFAPDQLPLGFSTGSIRPASGSVTIQHGVVSKNFTVVLTAKFNTAELFALSLLTAPSTTVSGGARLQTGKSLVRIEPYGLLRFADNSTKPAVTEMMGKIYLQVVRLYGSEGKIEGYYRAVGISAETGIDYVTIENHAVVMQPGQTSDLIPIEVVQDNRPEQEEKFFVNLTSIEKFPTETMPSVSPRISFLYHSSTVTIRQSNDPYGVLSIVPHAIEVGEQYQTVNLTVLRTGGVFGSISVLVRTVGGGESWTNLIVPKPGASSNDTITEILGNRDRFASATGGLDYEVLSTKLEFQQGQTEKSVNVTILADTMAEPDETVLVYLTEVRGGARVAAGGPDGGHKGVAVITITQNDLSNGVIGFAESSKIVTVDEDKQPEFTFKLARVDAAFGSAEVSWLAKMSETSTESQDVMLSAQLEKTAGTAICPARQEDCYFNISLKNDEIPEEAHTFVVKLTSAGIDAVLNTGSQFAQVNVLASDYIRGLLEFTPDSRVIVVSNKDTSVSLKVNRDKGQDYRVEVSFRTMQMTSQDVRSGYGIVISPALEGEDYDGQTGSLVFQPDRQELQYVEINLTPVQASANPYPKQLYVNLRNPSNGASLNPDASSATVIIVEEKDVEIWDIITDINMDDLDINNIISKLDVLIQPSSDMTEDEVTLVENILNTIVDKGLNNKFPNQDINRLLNILCKMLSPDKNDATRGRYSLAEIMEKIAYLMVTDALCSMPTPPDMLSMECAHAKVSAGRWPIERVQGFQYAAQRGDVFTIPDIIPDPPLTGDTECHDFHMVEYTSEQWFMKSDYKQLMSNKIIGFGIKNRPSTYTEYPATFKIHSPDRRIAAREAQCVYFDKSLRDWVGEVCSVTNDKTAGSDDFVDCSCKHLTHYAVRSKVVDSGLVGYSIWFYISCFISMGGLFLAILAHHLFSISSMFSASLLMHMCFACMATQVCYVVAAYLSPSEILVNTLEEDNYRCVVMGLFLHYFFLAQFSWMMTQAVNFWKILVLNDEHTDRKYVLFFLLGWGLPVVILAIFYVVVFNVYKYIYNLPYDFIYGDVNNNNEMCFITNPYSVLGGVVVPVLLMLVVVAVVFIKAFQVAPQWQAYDDIYRGRYNIREVRTLLLFWAVIIFTWLWGSLHMAYGHLWMLIVFCIFNIIQGLMALVLFGLLRNPFVTQCFAPQKATSYAVNATILDPTHPHPQHPSRTGQYQFQPVTLDIGSLKGSRASLLNESWERDSLPSRPSTMKVKRTLPSGGNIYVDPPVLRQGPESDTKDFDDLLYALKTGGSFTPSDINSSDSDKLSDISSKLDKYELRRIDIADTHL